MATITPTPIIVKNATLQLGANTYEAAVKTATLTPNVTVATAKGITPGAVYVATGITTWTLELEFFQSFNTNDLSVILFNGEGNTSTFSLRPVAGGVGYSGSVILVPGAVGGNADDFATASVSLPLTGKPAAVAAV